LPAIGNGLLFPLGHRRRKIASNLLAPLSDESVAISEIFCLDGYLAILWIGMRFKGLDLNLFVAFQVLLERQNVSRAAEDLRLSQSAVSAALARLRQYFDDPLLIADGKRMIPTAHAMRLKPLVAELLADAAGIVAVSSNFDPATAVRHFRIGTSDYIGTVAIAPLLRRLAAWRQLRWPVERQL
jgi:hypothetical protein